jgi:hypothetical protein
MEGKYIPYNYHQQESLRPLSLLALQNRQEQQRHTSILRKIRNPFLLIEPFQTIKTQTRNLN